MISVRRLLLVGSLALIALTPIAANPPSAGAPEDPDLNRLATDALQRDEGLAKLNIGVRVLRGGSAILSGSASPAEAARAEAVLKALPGITGVVNTCDPTDGAGVLPSAPHREPAKPPAIRPAPAGAPASRAGEGADRLKVEPVSRHEPAARLLDPVPVGRPVDYAAVERVRTGDPRFARLTFDLRDDRVVIAGSAKDAATAWELARQVAPLVGGRDVVVGKIGR